jgi:predicted AlkP superfamily phosphohydrolase/phosphomutase
MSNKDLYKKNFQKLFIVFTILFFIASVLFQKQIADKKTVNKTKVYWFIPDGLRADRDQFNIFEWADKGELPNLRRLMANGTYGYSRPVFPGHTPTNFATLLTGVNPDKHGIADGAMRTFGYPLKMVSKGGFTSFAKLVEPIWIELENENYLVSLQSVPGSTPPEIFKGNVIKGRWGGWGAEFPSVVIQSDDDLVKEYKKIGNNRRVFLAGPELTKYVNLTKGSTNRECDVEFWGNKINFQSNLSTLTKKFENVVIKFEKQKINLHKGQWSQWLPISLTYQLKNDYQINSPKKTNFENELSSITIETKVKFKLIDLTEDGNFRIRLLVNSLNEFLTEPTELSMEMNQKIGPMIDFVDNYPPQLVYNKYDKDTFIEEANESWQWHQNVVPYLMKDLRSDFIIHSVYNPNQMLTSKWWLPYVDKNGHGYHSISDKEREVLWSEVKHMYQEADKVLGKILENADENTYIIFSSDHGAIPLNKEVRLNNLFAQKGWLKFYFNPTTNSYEVNWKETKVVYLQMNNIYINPKGLDGAYQPATGSDYQKLRNEVIGELVKLKDPENGKKVLSYYWPREAVGDIHMPKDRVGDLVISNAPGFNWAEDLNEDQKVFATSVKGGYKQALMPKDVEGLLTPFIIVGPGVKANSRLNGIINHVDQYATVAKLTKIKHPTKPILDGRVLNEIFVNP